MNPIWEASLQTVIDSVDLAVTVVDHSGHVLEWNPAAQRMYGISREAIVGRPIAQFFSSASLMVWQVLETGRAVESTFHQPRPGTHVMITAAPVFVNGRLVGAIALERDVTRLMQLSTDLSAAADRVAVLERQIGGRGPDEPDSDPFEAVRGRHPAIRRALDLARRVAPTDAITLIRGETGVGKELFARGIHLASKRGRGPLVVLNCGAIPPSLFESELFGHAPSAFTGANPKGQIGKMELADGGTLFLDEVAELPLESQIKLLRFLEDRRFYRVGGTAPVTVNVRILAATNQPLESMVAQGRFRPDLYWRINVVALDLPPLRERREDIYGLVELYLHEFQVRHGRAISTVDPAVLQALLAHDWPGNVRELRNTVERLVVLADDGRIGPGLLPDSLSGGASTAAPPPEEPVAASPPVGSTLEAAVEAVERDRLLEALASERTVVAAARRLGISRGTLYQKMMRLGIQRPVK